MAVIKNFQFQPVKAGASMLATGVNLWNGLMEDYQAREGGRQMFCRYLRQLRYLIAANPKLTLGATRPAPSLMAYK
jgi:hypothetical protein